MKYLLDTNAWLFGYANVACIPPAEKALMSDENEVFGLSVMSVWEVGKKHQIGKLQLDQPFEQWLDKALRPNLTLLDLTPDIIVKAMQLRGFPNKDPADELIVATANVHGLTLLTCDKLLRRYAHAKIHYFKPLGAI